MWLMNSGIFAEDRPCSTDKLGAVISGPSIRVSIKAWHSQLQQLPDAIHVGSSCLAKTLDTQSTHFLTSCRRRPGSACPNSRRTLSFADVPAVACSWPNLQVWIRARTLLDFSARRVLQVSESPRARRCECIVDGPQMWSFNAEAARKRACIDHDE